MKDREYVYGSGRDGEYGVHEAPNSIREKAGMTTAPHDDLLSDARIPNQIEYAQKMLSELHATFSDLAERLSGILLPDGPEKRFDPEVTPALTSPVSQSLDDLHRQITLIQQSVEDVKRRVQL